MLTVIHIVSACSLLVFAEGATKRDCTRTDIPLPPTAKNTTALLLELRKNMVAAGVQGYIIPDRDPHQTEYIAAAFKRRAFITGFKGSAGTAAVTLTSAALITDSRYFDQAELELDCNWILIRQGLPNQESSVAEWLAKQLSPRSVVGVDPLLYSQSDFVVDQQKLNASGIMLKSVDENLVDKVWKDRPDIPAGKMIMMPDELSGETWQSKIKRVRSAMDSNKADVLVLNQLDEIAWLLNLRCVGVIDWNPFFLAYMVITKDLAWLFASPSTFAPDVRKFLNTTGCDRDISCVVALPYDNFTSKLPEINNFARFLWIDPSLNYAAKSLLNPSQLFVQQSPIALMKAKKNSVEMKGMINANLKDSVAIIEFISWLLNEVKSGGTVTELSAVDKLTEFKQNQTDFISLSFNTIAGFGPNGAIIHYGPSPATNVQLTADNLFLLDSGCQFMDGSTDITRTIHLGQPTQFQKDTYTMVLMGVIDLASTIFPYNSRGSRLDAFARRPLWNHGLDYAHGTGHGIGHFLSIHEGPANIGSRASTTEKAIDIGMVFSDEPGFYKSGEFGIRLESAMRVISANTTYPDPSMKFLTFELITLVPFQKILINQKMLTEGQIRWLNSYNQRVREELKPRLLPRNKVAYQWVLDNTLPLHSSASSQVISGARYILHAVLFSLFYVLISS